MFYKHKTFRIADFPTLYCPNSVIITNLDEIFSVTKRDAVFHGHVHGVGITAPCESAAADIISAYER